MRTHCLIAGAMALLCVFSTVESAHANVNGKAFAATIYTLSQTHYTNTYIFADDGGDPNTGPFGVMEGGQGNWQQWPLQQLSLWSAAYSYGNRTSNITGIQVGTRMYGYGNSSTGGLFLVLPYP